MTIPDILALDFDGVCCDGLREYFETSRRTCARVWSADEPPGESAFEAFCALRPVILSGWEMSVRSCAPSRGRSRARRSWPTGSGCGGSSSRRRRRPAPC